MFTWYSRATMKNITSSLLLALSCFAAYADEWHGPDKQKHAIGGALIGAAVTAGTGSAWAGCAAGSAAGLAKEIYDERHRDRHDPSAKDFIVTAVAACLSAGATGLVVTPGGIFYTRKF